MISIALSRPRALLSVSWYSASGTLSANDTRTCLDVGRVVVDDDRSQGDAGIHVAGEVDVADGTGVRAAAIRFELVDDFHRFALWERPKPCRPAGRQPRPSNESQSSRSSPQTVRGNVHDVAVTLDHHHVRDFDRVVLGDAADVVAAEVDEHHMLGPFLRVGEQFFAQALILVVGLATLAGASKRSNSKRDGQQHEP